MLKIDYRTLRSESFQVAMRKIGGSDSYKNTQKLKKVSGLLKAANKALSASQVEWIELANKYIQKDVEKGTFKFEKNEPVWLEGMAEAGEKAIDDYMNKSEILESPKLSVHDIESVGLSPLDLLALDSVVS